MVCPPNLLVKPRTGKETTAGEDLSPRTSRGGTRTTVLLFDWPERVMKGHEVVAALRHMVGLTDGEHALDATEPS